MSLAPFYAAAPHIKVHILAAMLVIGLTPLQFWGFRKGSMPHRVAGYFWLGAMLAVAGTSFWIRSHFSFSVLGFSPIHLLSVWAIVSVGMAIHFARIRRISTHRKVLIGLSTGFWVAGAFTLIPPRIMGMILWN